MLRTTTIRVQLVPSCFCMMSQSREILWTLRLCTELVFHSYSNLDCYYLHLVQADPSALRGH